MDDELLDGDGDGDGDGDQIVCPMPCTRCVGPGDCEDCLDCLHWPNPVVDSPIPPTIPRGPSSPVMASELAEARAGLGLGQRVGLVLRRFRREHRLSQRALADRVGWNRATLARVEKDSSSLPLGRAQELLRHTGHRLAIVPDTGPDTELGEDPPHAWGVPDLVARDARGRRLPPSARVRYRPRIERLMDARIVEHEEPWVWMRWDG